MSPIFWEVRSKGRGLKRDPADKPVRTGKKLCLLIFFTPEYVVFHCLAEAVISVFYTLFLSPGGHLATLPPWCSLTDFLALVLWYHGGVTMGSKFSLAP